uniref:Uncharacterized protein n=1 Tax=Dendroctonus ponderosae TaxID=77166 RepID=A0AAR5Q006_DENPD
MLDEPSGAKRPANPIRVVPDPPVLFASLAVDVASMHPKDFAGRPWDEQALHPPEPALREGRPPAAPTPVEAAVFSRVLEEGLAQVVFGQKMRSLLLGAARAPHCFYSQFTATNQEQRAREVGRFLRQPSPPLMGRLLRRLIHQGLCAARCPAPQPTPPNLARYTCRNQQCACRPPDTHSLLN